MIRSGEKRRSVPAISVDTLLLKVYKTARSAATKRETLTDSTDRVQEEKPCRAPVLPAAVGCRRYPSSACSKGRRILSWASRSDSRPFRRTLPAPPATSSKAVATSECVGGGTKYPHAFHSVAIFHTGRPQSSASDFTASAVLTGLYACPCARRKFGVSDRALTRTNARKQTTATRTATCHPL